MIDATGKYVFPGFIDPHTHIYLPFMGTFARDDYESASHAALLGGSYWNYTYNSNGELIGGHHLWTNGAAMAGQQFDYHYDGIGDRSNSATPHSSTVVNGRGATYSVNVLNQYTSRDVPGAVDVMGTADPAATVTVNNQAVSTRAGHYFDTTVPVSNANAPVNQSVDVLGFKGGAGAGGADVVSETQGNVFVPQTPEQFSYDLDGNLTQDGHWTYVWDGENRLVEMTALASVPAPAKLQLKFAYDWTGRRVQKQVFGWNAATNAFATTPTSSTRFEVREDTGPRDVRNQRQ